MKDLKQNLDNVSARLRSACQAAGRSPAEVRLLAVSKRHSAESIRILNGYGQFAFGENIVREATEKQKELRDLDLEWHFVGPIQSNKTRVIAENFDWAQSVDRRKLLERLSNQRPDHLQPLCVCIQVNIDAEPQKSGVEVTGVRPLLEMAESLPGISPRGLMAIPRVSEPGGGSAFESFQRMRALFDECRAAGHDLDTLSMGMSADLEVAIAAGSTMVRIGTDIFGPREQNS